MAAAPRPTGQQRRRGASTTSSGAPTFDVFEENSGRHRWQLTASDGKGLATSSDSFASRDDAQRAAADVSTSWVVE